MTSSVSMRLNSVSMLIFTNTTLPWPTNDRWTMKQTNKQMAFDLNHRKTEWLWVLEVVNLGGDLLCLVLIEVNTLSTEQVPNKLSLRFLDPAQRTRVNHGHVDLCTNILCVNYNHSYIRRYCLLSLVSCILPSRFLQCGLQWNSSWRSFRSIWKMIWKWY